MSASVFIQPNGLSGLGVLKKRVGADGSPASFLILQERLRTTDTDLTTEKAVESSSSSMVLYAGLGVVALVGIGLYWKYG